MKRLDRRQFLGVIALTLAPVPPVAAQRVARARIAYLSLALPDADRSWLLAFRSELRALGHEEGRNCTIDVRHAHGHAERLSFLADELLGLKPDVMVVYGAWHIAHKLAGGPPVVFTVVPDPVAQGVVPSLARPGGNITGFSDAHADLVPKRLQLIKEIAPATKRVGVLYYSSSMTEMQVSAARSAAPSQGLSVIPVAVNGPQKEEVERAFAAMLKEGAEALLVIADQTVFTNRGAIAALAIKHRLPIISTVREWAEAGFTLSYGTNFHDLWRRSAIYVDRILKGARPGDLPVEQPTKFDLVVNAKTARAIGVSVPPSLILQADHVIQ